MNPDSVSCPKCGAVDDYKTSQSGPHVRADCNQCGRFIKFLPQSYPTDVKLYFGKYTNQRVNDITDLSYLQWADANLSDINPKTRNAIKSRIVQLQAL